MSLQPEQRMSISSALLKSTLEYIAQHPYRDVFQLIHALQQDAREIPVEPVTSPPQEPAA